jgi:HlyD family secretion protein
MNQASTIGWRTPWFAGLLRKPWLRWAGAAALLTAAVVGAASVFANRSLTLQVAQIEENVPIRVFGIGTVEARVLSRISFEVGATLVEVNVDHGDRVAKGQVLARLSAGEQEAKVAKARAAILIAEMNIGKSAANLEKARAMLTQRQEANRRKQALAGRDVVSQQAAEEALRDEAVARADVAVAESEAETAKALLTDARAQLQYEQTMLRHRTLAAPYDAMIIERHKEAGTVIKPGDPIFTVIALDSYWGLAYVDEARSGFIAEGQRVEARLRSRPQETFTGRVIRIGLESDRVTEERRVFIRGDAPPQPVYLGEQAEFWITVARLDKSLLVPEAAVHGYDGREGRVWTIDDGHLRRRLVRFRHRTEDARLEILDPLPETVRVVTRLEDGLREGRPARAAEAVSR